MVYKLGQLRLTWPRDLGIIVQKYPTVLGADAAGLVEEVGDGVTHLKRGQRVIGYVPVTRLRMRGR